MKTLQALVAAELNEPIDPRITEMAAALAAGYGETARAVLFYGSCLRESQLDGLMLDFYLIVSDYDRAYQKRWLATANRLIPPNVFPFSFNDLAAKYAVLSEADFDALNSLEASTVSVWARFSQPSRLAWSAGPGIVDAIATAIAKASHTLLSLAAPIASSSDVLSIWRVGFENTYQAELRAERSGRNVSIIDADPERYRRFGEVAELSAIGREDALRRWKQLKRKGKLMTVIRLAKASLTFAGGIDYLAWKVNRHAGTKIEIKPWQRRWPLVAALFLVPKLMRGGAIR